MQRKKDIVAEIREKCTKAIWITEKGKIFAETFTPEFPLTQEFLGVVAEPLSRPKHIHEYHITQYSLHAACALGLGAEKIIAGLAHLSKTPVPDKIKTAIQAAADTYGRVKIVLTHNRHFIESDYPETLRLLRDDDVLRASQKRVSERKEPERKMTKIEREKHRLRRELADTPEAERSTPLEAENRIEIDRDSLEDVRKRCIDLEYPVLEEYNFKQDTTTPSAEIHLRPTTLIRDYQEHSLRKMFVGDHARSGIIVLPCGAGKTLVGIAAACTIQKSVLIICTSGVSVEQWRKEFLKYTAIDPQNIARFTSESKERTCMTSQIIITTYNMLLYSKERSANTTRILDEIYSRQWGLLILDEVHVVPARTFRNVLTAISVHCKLGLTATLLREDEKIEDLNFLIGPKLHEANWHDLATRGHIAAVACTEFWCPMPACFYREYLQETPKRRRLLYMMNPTKFSVCKHLIEKHERQGDKVIVFSDNLFALKRYAIRLKKPYIYGPTSQPERLLILSEFQKNPKVNTIFLSKVGDTSIDIPEANCLIQISSHYGSRRQEAQRLGRILRAKKMPVGGHNAFFYSLVSKDTAEMYYSARRRQFLIDQGYAFTIVPDGHKHNSVSEDVNEELLKEVLMIPESEELEEAEEPQKHF
ncbi:MAG: transcription factor TFIIH complex ERCC-3 subunit [Amphiamblys sp. WSBS2006]|nr:MAG: transcription factor TFIIH complex ERCC-3 subunit [Amphiamblys sp. WSBS2006]